MRTLLSSVGWLLLAASAALAKPYDAEIAAYDAMLAAVQPGQMTIVMGDMTVPVGTVQLWRDRLAGTAPADSASQTGITKWPGGIVYYAFNANVSAVGSPSHQTMALDAMAEWAAFANLTFVARTSQTSYVMINDGGAGLSGGNSAVGMLPLAQQPQQLNIGSGSWNRGTLVHELGHALGLIHEHQRGDGVNSRDNFVMINFGNVPGGPTDGNFILIPTATGNGVSALYDFLSVMHYPRKQFAVNTALDTITPKAGYTQFGDIMGTSPDRILSRRDRDGMAAMYPPAPVLSTVVTNSKDSGPGSLRTAIYKAFDLATDTPGATPVISFQIPNTDPNFSGGVYTIRPTDRLPAPGPGTIIDATTQTAFTSNTNANGPEVVLNGALQPPLNPYGMALRLSAANVTVKGLVINGCANQGILITTGATGASVVGCYIGTNAAGTAAVANAFAGIEISGGATGNRVGGTTAATRNVISGNAVQGVFIKTAGTSGNVVSGNYIGTNAAGTAALANVAAGVDISVSASGNTVGGSAAGAGNLLSGNATQGVKISDAGTTGNVVAGNIAGLNAAGTGALPNVFSGVGIFNGATGNTIGGTVAGAGNIISGNTIQGIYITDTGTNSNTVAGNWIGLNGAGTAKVANGTSGIEIGNGPQNNVVGGTTAGARNVISGNTDRGVFFYNTTGNVVLGNYIGTNPAGTAAIGNLWTGVEIQSGGTVNTIGGTAPGARNVISGNVGRNVLIDFAGTANNTVAGNFIGLNAAGTAALVNGGPGVQIWGGAQGNTIGGTSGGRNYISGNTGAGLTISDSGTNSNIIVGNSIGTTPTGTVVANTAEGISIFNGPQNNTIGGSTPGAANLISGNNGAGVAIYNNGTTGNRISGNSITGNGSPGSALGIDIGGDGVTANDAGDADTGPNNLQNYPIVTAAALGLATTVSGTLNSTASTTFRIEFFANAAGDSSGSGEGQNFIGAISVTTNASSTATFTNIALPAIVPVGQKISATATDPSGNTSEFSATNTAASTVTIADADSDGLPNAYEFAITASNTALIPNLDDDGDGMTNAQEFRAGTNPRNAASILRLGPPATSGPDKTVSLPSLLGITYRIDYADDLLSANHWRTLVDQISGTGAALTITDPGAAALTQRYYRAVVVP